MIKKLALRNIIRHGKSSLLILFFMTIVGVIFMVGNSLLLTVNQSMKKGFQNNITGDAVLMMHPEEPMSLFGALIPSIGEFFSFPVLLQQQELEKLLTEQSWIDSITPLISGNAVMDFKNNRMGIPYFGIQSETHLKTFNDIEIIDGVSSFSGHGVMIPESLVKEWIKTKGVSINVGDYIKLSTAGDTGFRIRSVPVQAIYRYPYQNPVVDSLALVDAGTARDLLEVLHSQIKDSSPEEASDLLGGDLDELFSMEDNLDTTEEIDLLDSMDSLFEEPAIVEEDSQGSWHFLLVRFNPDEGGNPQKKLQQLLKDFNVDILSWRQAAGQSASYAYFIQLFFYLGFILIMMTGILGIVNIMLISLFQRTVEIGTIQALGGTSSFIRNLLSMEYFMLSLLGGLISLVFCFLLFQWLNAQQIIIGNSIINMIFGGKPLYFPFTMPLILINLALSLGVGALASLYPISRALALEPVEALKGADR